MVKLKFVATAKKASHLHKRAGFKEGTYAGKPTLKPVGPVILSDGDEIEVSKYIAQHALLRYPDNFEEVKPKSKPAPKLDSEES